MRSSTGCSVWPGQAHVPRKKTTRRRLAHPPAASVRQKAVRGYPEGCPDGYTTLAWPSKQHLLPGRAGRNLNRRPLDPQFCPGHFPSDTSGDNSLPTASSTRDFIRTDTTADDHQLPPFSGFSGAMVLTAVLTDGHFQRPLAVTLQDLACRWSTGVRWRRLRRSTSPKVGRSTEM